MYFVLAIKNGHSGPPFLVPTHSPTRSLTHPLAPPTHPHTHPLTNSHELSRTLTNSHELSRTLTNSHELFTHEVTNSAALGCSLRCVCFVCAWCVTLRLRFPCFCLLFFCFSLFLFFSLSVFLSFCPAVRLSVSFCGFVCVFVFCFCFCFSLRFLLWRCGRAVVVVVGGGGGGGGGVGGVGGVGGGGALARSLARGVWWWRELRSLASARAVSSRTGGVLVFLLLATWVGVWKRGGAKARN